MSVGQNGVPFANPILLGEIVSLIAQPEGTRDITKGYLLAMGMFLVPLVSMFFRVNFFRANVRSGVHVRAVLLSWSSHFVAMSGSDAFTVHWANFLGWGWR